LLAGDGGLPEIDFTLGACTFCADCKSACSEGIFDPAALAPWSYKASIADLCLANRQVMCQSCGDSCAARAIRFTRQAGRVPVPKIDAALCTGCGACVSVCPVEAVQVATPSEMQHAQ
jgi:ferredoxin-type protein NapF